MASVLNTPVARLCCVLHHADDYYDEFRILDPRKPGKARLVVSPRGPVRRWQSLLYSRVLAPGLKRSPHSHGGVAGRGVLTNLAPHVGNTFVYTTDIANFYPSVGWRRILKLFRTLGCSDQAGWVCTRLCTYRHRLEQGLVTSPILADQLMVPLDRRIGDLCSKYQLTYTRFVDDLAISGRYDFSDRSVSEAVNDILRQGGFRPNPDKETFRPVRDGATITGLRFKNGHPDVKQSYVDGIHALLADAARVASGMPPLGHYFTDAQIRGRIEYVCWVNPRRGKDLWARFKRVKWSNVHVWASKLGLESCVKRAVPASN